jgi:hypothetical protein
MHVIAELSIFPGLLLQGEHFFFINLFYSAPFGKNKGDQTDRRALAMMYIDAIGNSDYIVI